MAESFDTMGWLFRNLEDAPLLAETFSVSKRTAIRDYTNFAIVDDAFLHDCEPPIVESLRNTAEELRAFGMRETTVDVSWWRDALDIFAPIQAWEAARIHSGHFDKIQPAIRERLEWGASITDSELSVLRERHDQFRVRLDAELSAHQLILLPASPVAS